MVEARLSDDGHLLFTTKGGHFPDTLFIVIESSNQVLGAGLFKNLGDIACDEPDFLFVIDDDAKFRPERAIVDFLYVIHNFVTLSL